jgi:exodeoxyribonuclease VIII
MAEIPGLWHCTNDEYHADTSSISHSMLEKFRQSVPLYHGLYVAKTLPRDEPTPAMKLGTALHAWLLEPQNWTQLVAVGPDCERRSNADKARWAEFGAASVGKTVITREQEQKVFLMADSVKANATAKALLAAAGPNEQAIRWQDSSGLICKAKFDRALDAKFVLDIKTTRDLLHPDSWAKTCGNFGYARQAAHYLEGWSRVFRGNPDHLHLVFSTEEPYECAVFELDALSIQLGRDQNRRDLDALALCYESGCWASRLADKIIPIQLPRWEFTKEETALS